MGQTAPAAPTPAAPAPEPAVTATAPERPACADPSDEPEDQLSDAAPAEAAAAAAADPVEAHCSQNAGDQQYQDPFAGSKPPGGKNGGGGDGNSAQTDGATQQDTPTAVPAQDPATGSVDPTATATPTGEQLPSTGLGLAGLLVLGVPLLLSGVVLRRRLA